MPHLKKVMIIDDQPEIVELVEGALKGRGYRTAGFVDPMKAIKAFIDNNQDYALVISDIRMQGMNGFEIARSIKEARPDMPLVIMTSFEINKREFSAVFPSMPISDLITKPVSIDMLTSVVRKHFCITKQH